jgi:hypothetical protein
MTCTSLTPDRLRYSLRKCLRWQAYQRAQTHPAINIPADVFRSSSLAVAARRVFPKSCHTLQSPLVIDEFSRFIDERENLCDGTSCDSAVLEAELFRSRALLITDWSRSLFDGSAASETDGFIDEDSMPPWDCWLDLMELDGGSASLLSWVPLIVASKVDVAIVADAGRCMSWLKVGPDNTIQLLGWGERWYAGPANSV